MTPTTNSVQKRASRRPTYPVSYARWRLRGSSQAVSGWSTAIRLGWATSIVSATLSPTTPVIPHHRLLLYPIHDRPNPSRDQIPIGCFRYDQIPVPAFWLFRCGHVTKSHLTLAQEDEWSCFRTGNASLRKRAVWGVQSGNQGRWWQKDNRRISNHVRSVFSPLTDISTQGWLFLLSLLVSYLLEAKAQNGICPRRSFRSS